MFNRSKKYIFLLIVNIIVLFAIFLNKDVADIGTADPFDTEYVIGLLQKEEKLVTSVSDLNQQLTDSGQTMTNVQSQLEQTQILLGQSAQKYRACEAEKLIIIEDARDQVREISNKAPSKVASCEAELLEVSIAGAKITTLEKLVRELREKYSAAREELLQRNQLLSQIQNKDRNDLEELKLENIKLKKVLREPIAIESHYLSAKYCDKPKFDSLICVEELLLRPSFTKSPITKLGINVLDKNGNIVASGLFNSSKAQLFRLALGRGKELSAGDYMVEYKVDNQTLLSKLVELKQ